ncbi:esterase B1 [Drosophila madeirensis]|uniref:carboxylesterase n=1 Tax=Drosophila madeirensis TaxID=30013 RepID=A0AAU9F670_DROMD
MSDYSETTAPVVQTTHGRVRGVMLKALYDEEEFYAFDGIPYAVPPLGTLRFKEPHDLKPWHGIRDCSKPLDKCIQVSSYTKQVEGSEDCLYLNISVKTLKSEEPLPLMVYVHGGGFKGGDASRRAWGPDYFMRENVIHISIGHRLGPLGFLSFADPSLEIPGNAGLKDIILALKWIKANAGNFNGDPDPEKAEGRMMPFVPVVEGYVTPQSVLLSEPVILQRTAWSNRIPVIMGSNSGEGLSFNPVLRNANSLQELKKHPECVLPQTLLNRCDPGQRRQLGQSLLDHFCQAHGHRLSIEHTDALSHLWTHNMMHSQERLVLARLSYGQAPTYLYRFDFDSPDFNLYRIRFFGKEQRGVSHVDELGYIYVLPSTFKLDKSRPEYTTICRMVAMFVNFAATSDPNAELTKPLVEWKPVKRFGPRMILNISEELKFVPQPERQKLTFYDRLYEQAGVTLF